MTFKNASITEGVRTPNIVIYQLYLKPIHPKMCQPIVSHGGSGETAVR